MVTQPTAASAPDAGTAALAMGDQYRLAEARGDRRGGVADMDHERAVASSDDQLRNYQTGLHFRSLGVRVEALADKVLTWAVYFCTSHHLS